MMINSPTPPRAGHRLVAAVATLGLAGASLLAVGAAPAMAAGSICGVFERAPVSGGAFVVQNNAWGDTSGQCVSPRDGGFTITKAEGNLAFGGAPKSYPSIFAGEHYGQGSNTASLPVKVSAIGSARTSAKITPAAGAYNAAWDIWVDTSPDSPDENDDTEIMVWPFTKGDPTPIGTKVDTVTFESRPYDVWKGKGPGGTDVVSYVDQEMTTTPDISLAPFLKDSIARGATSADSYVTSVQFGFEPWKSGKGLAVDDFTYTPSSSGERRSYLTSTPAGQAEQPSPTEQAEAVADQDGNSRQGGESALEGQDQDEDGAPSAGQQGSRSLLTASGRCAQVDGDPDQGAAVAVQECGKDSAQWQRGDGASVVNTASGLCLTAAGRGDDDGPALSLQDCDEGAADQAWTLR